MVLEASIADIDFAALTSGRTYHPSPTAWEDEVLYFLMLDRFSDGKECDFRGNDGSIVAEGADASTRAFSEADRDNAISTTEEASAWRDAGGRWCGGTLKGLTGKIGYLKRLGVTAIWISPVFKQVAFQQTYHGYGIQNFLDVDPHFGTRDDLKDLVTAAHFLGIRVILDIILNHSGAVFSYDADRYPTSEPGAFDPRWDGGSYRVAGFNDRHGQPIIPFQRLPRAADGGPSDDAIWPRDLQEPVSFTARGRISGWDHSPEYLEGDFFDLKDIRLGEGQIDTYQPSPALKALCDVYRFWIAFADLDGFRVDTVKHMDPGAARYFGSVIHEFAQTLGKDKFYLIAEIAGGRPHAYTTLETTGLDAALGIDDIPDKLEWIPKGRRNPSDYFDLFRNSILVGKGTHTWFRDKVVTVLDDHDQIRNQSRKARFGATNPPVSLALAALTLNAMTIGIPCIYYGSEQLFDGTGDNDRYLRECMFGGPFGAFRSRGKHFFKEDEWLYQELAKVLEVRHQNLPLRRGRQYLREISGNGADFGFPRMIGAELRSIVAWSRILDRSEVLVAINTDMTEDRTASVIIDHDLHQPETEMRCIYSTNAGAIGTMSRVFEMQDGKRFVRLTLPAAGVSIFR
ncbi:alpha-amylase family glycosyl hydrolase [Neorhizobium alkalisoli]|uniref:alpha-amylase family glycosyl hydrolase n=1 Tax=Neorhizobium alkalisoli TaxID=528178 RepID=UPI000CF92F51|nr:alpha-amylase family glycosyl hydrolase [Neorhizobium alkalisoli]